MGSLGIVRIDRERSREGVHLVEDGERRLELLLRKVLDIRAAARLLAAERVARKR